MAEAIDFIRYEQGEMTVRESVELFADIIGSKMAFALQGSYGRTAMMYINNNIIDRHGVINEEVYAKVQDDL